MESRVKRLVFELNCPDQAAALGVRARLPMLVDAAVVPALDQALSRFGLDERTYQIDRIEIDLGRFDLDTLDATHWRETIAGELGRFLSDLPVETTTEAPAVSLVATFAHFLTTGALPWHAAGRSLAALEAEAQVLKPIDADRFVARLRPLLRGPPQSLRFALQCGAQFVAWVLGRLQAVTAGQLHDLVRSVSDDFSPGQKSAILVRAAATLAAGATPAMLRWQVEQLAGAVLPPDGGERADQDKAMRAAVDEARFATPVGRVPQPGDPTKSLSAPPHGVETPAAQPAEDGWYVGHAGLVLLHPFFPRFFDALGLLNAQQFRSPQARERAVHLLHFLASGTEHPEEHATLLCKLLCGIPFELPIPRELALRDEERTEANALLAAAIGHWGRLGSASPDGLREGFLARDGKLVRTGTGFVLTVEQRAIDLLLDHLPWTLSIVRLPWMARPLMVDWA